MLLNSETAEVCGIHAGDGYLRNDGRRRELDISGNVEEQTYYDNHVIPLFERVFNIKIRGRFFPYRNTYGFVVRIPEIIILVHELGFPYGSKSTIVSVPDFILGDKPLEKGFLRGYFDTDGCLTFQKQYGNYTLFKRTRHHYPRLMFSTVSNRLANGLKEILEDLKFDFTFCKWKPKKQTESLKYGIVLNGIKNLEKWLNIIGMGNHTKYSRFLIWKKYGFCPTNTTYTERLKILKGLINPNTFYGPMVQPG